MEAKILLSNTVVQMRGQMTDTREQLHFLLLSRDGFFQHMNVGFCYKCLLLFLSPCQKCSTYVFSVPEVISSVTSTMHLLPFAQDSQKS